MILGFLLSVGLFALVNNMIGEVPKSTLSTQAPPRSGLPERPKSSKLDPSLSEVLERWVAGIPLIEDKKSRLEQEILKIEKDKHDEATKFWKDTTGVKDELLETVRELRKVQGHQELLSSPEPETQGTANYTEGFLY